MSYVPVGCFRDRNAGVRPLPELLSSYRYHIDWNRVNLMVEKCAQDAWAKQFPVFGVQYYAECWSGRSGYLTYDKDGPNLDGCWQGVGKGWNNYVYAFTSMYCDLISVSTIVMKGEVKNGLDNLRRQSEDCNSTARRNAECTSEPNPQGIAFIIG